MSILRLFHTANIYYMPVFHMPITVPFVGGVVVSKKGLILTLMELKI